MRPIKQWPQSEVIIDENSKRELEGEVKGNKVLHETKLVSAEDPPEEPVKETRSLRY